MRVLDGARGPGYLAGAASARGADAVGLDVAAGDAWSRTHPLSGDRLRPRRRACPAGCGRVVRRGDDELRHPPRGRSRAWLLRSRACPRLRRDRCVHPWAGGPSHAPAAIAGMVTPLAEPSPDIPAGPRVPPASDLDACAEALPAAGFEPGSVQFETVRASWRLLTAGQLFEASCTPASGSAPRSAPRRPRRWSASARR